MKFWQAIILIILISAIGVGLSIWQPWKISNRQIQVSADGKIKSSPDVSKISAGVEVKKPTAEEAQKNASEKISKIVDAIKAKGIKEKDIKTEDISVNPNYENPIPLPGREFQTMEARINGYAARSIVTVTIRDIKKAQEIVDLATANGANSVYGPQLTFSEEKLENLQNQARELAVKNAKAKADKLAQTTGNKVGKVISINENSNDGLFYPMMSTDMAGNVKSAAESQPTRAILPGENEITVSVNVIYALK